MVYSRESRPKHRNNFQKRERITRLNKDEQEKSFQTFLNLPEKLNINLRVISKVRIRLQILLSVIAGYPFFKKMQIGKLVNFSRACISANPNDDREITSKNVMQNYQLYYLI